MLRAEATPSRGLLFRCGVLRIPDCPRLQKTFPGNPVRRQNSTVGAAVLAFLLKGEICHEYNSDSSDDAYKRPDPSLRIAAPQRTQLKQHVSKTAGGTASKSEPFESHGSGAVCGATGAIQRIERGDIDLSAAAAERACIRRVGIGIGFRGRNATRERRVDRRQRCKPKRGCSFFHASPRSWACFCSGRPPFYTHFCRTSPPHPTNVLEFRTFLFQPS